MTDTMTLTGFVATPPRHLITSEGLPVTSFRLASNQRRFDRSTGKWVDAGTNWYTVSTFRDLAVNVFDSIHKGDRVFVAGRLHIKNWESGEKKGTDVGLDASTIGHDLSWGKSSFTRIIKTTELPDESFPADATEKAADSGSLGEEAETLEHHDLLAPVAESMPVPF